MTSTTKTIRGSDLKLGDVIDTWAGKKRIVGLKPYDNEFARSVWPEGARIAEFDIGSGMSISNDDVLVIASFEAA